MLHFPYVRFRYQVMQLCWNPNPEARPTAAQVHALLNHLHFTHKHTSDAVKDDGYASNDFEERWQRLKPNTIPKIDEHVAIVHAPSTSMASHFTGSDQEFDNNQTIQDSLSVEMDTAVSRSSSIMSDKDPLSIQMKSDSLTNLHGSLEDVRNIYLTHNETPTLECHQGNINLEESKEKEQDRSDSSVDPWLKDIITDSQDDVSYYKDVSDVIKNLDNILNSEKTSSSESSHQASPSRDNLSLECKKDYPMQTSMVKSPGISNFQNILEMGFAKESEVTEGDDEDEGDRDTVGTLSHSFERHSDTTSQQTLENITPETPIKGLGVSEDIEIQVNSNFEQNHSVLNKIKFSKEHQDSDLPKESRIASSDSEVPKLMELCVDSMPSVSETIEQVIIKQDCQTSYDNKFTNIKTDSTETKSIDLNKEFLSNEIGIKEKDTSTNIETEIHNSEESPSKKHSSLSASESTKEPTDSLVNNALIENVDKIVGINESLLEHEINSSNSHLLPEVEDKMEFETNERLSEFESSSKEPLDDLKPSSETDKILPTVKKNIDSNIQKIDNTSEITEISCEEHKENKNITFPEFDEIFKYKDDYSLESSLELLNNFSKNVNEDITSERDNDRNTQDSKDKSYPQSENSDVLKTKKQGLNNIESILSLSTDKNNLSDFNSRSEIFLTETHNTIMEIQEVNQFNPAEGNLESKSVNQGNKTRFENPTNDISDSHRNEENVNVLQSINDHLKQMETEQPERVQIISNVEVLSPLQSSSLLLGVNNQFDNVNNSNNQISVESFLMPEQVQTIDEIINSQSVENSDIDGDTYRLDDVQVSKAPVKEELSDSTVYMDLTNDINSQILKASNEDSTLKNVIKSCLEAPAIESSSSSIRNDSTVYLDLPSIIQETDSFLHSEKCISSQQIDFKDKACTSTPKGSDTSTDNTLEPVRPSTDILSETKVPDYGPGVTLTKLEQKYVPDNLSPFESPSKSHHTDTYDENSSVVLGPFENCTLDLYKGVKSMAELSDLPKEELLAFLSNFSEINLETPSPLRDGNFLNEVPDLLPDELHFDQIATMSEAKPESQSNEMISDETEEQSSTEKRVSPLTPPNSPGNFLASSSQQKYLVDIDINGPHVQDPSSDNETVDLNQIELQMTTKLAMAENENNLNIEYSGPLTEEGLTLGDSILTGDNDAIPESYLAGNGGSVEDLRENLAIDEERMKELRNELELKLPLAQVCFVLHFFIIVEKYTHIHNIYF